MSHCYALYNHVHVAHSNILFDKIIKIKKNSEFYTLNALARVMHNYVMCWYKLTTALWEYRSGFMITEPSLRHCTLQYAEFYLQGNIVHFYISFVQIAISLWTMFAINPRMTGVFLAFTPLQIIIIVLYGMSHLLFLCRV
jgi:ABC-type multidrug transport system fused ATPase/permease subunit